MTLASTRKCKSSELERDITRMTSGQIPVVPSIVSVLDLLWFQAHALAPSHPALQQVLAFQQLSKSTAVYSLPYVYRRQKTTGQGISAAYPVDLCVANSNHAAQVTGYRCTYSLIRICIIQQSVLLSSGCVTTCNHLTVLVGFNFRLQGRTRYFVSKPQKPTHCC